MPVYPVLTAASKAEKSAGIVVLASVPADHLAREVGLDLELARRAVEHDEHVLVVLAHLQALPEVEQAPHAAQRDDVGLW